MKQKFTKAQIRMIAEKVPYIPFEYLWRMYKMGLLHDYMLDYEWHVAMWMGGTLKRLPNPPARHPYWKRIRMAKGKAK